jgi:hypothetical protein
VEGHTEGWRTDRRRESAANKENNGAQLVLKASRNNVPGTGSSLSRLFLAPVSAVAVLKAGELLTREPC